MHQTEQALLGAHLVLASQREVIQPLVVAQVAKHQLDGGNSLAVQPLPTWAVDGRAHAVKGIVRVVGRSVVHGNLALRGVGLANALRSQCAVLTVADLCLELLPPMWRPR